MGRIALTVAIVSRLGDTGNHNVMEVHTTIILTCCTRQISEVSVKYALCCIDCGGAKQAGREGKLACSSGVK